MSATYLDIIPGNMLYYETGCHKQVLHMQLHVCVFQQLFRLCGPSCIYFNEFTICLDSKVYLGISLSVAYSAHALYMQKQQGGLHETLDCEANLDQ